MCLTLPKHPSLVAPKSPTKVLKAYYFSLHGNDMQLTPLFRGKKFNLRKDMTIVSNRTSSTVSDEERKSGIITLGLHGFTTLSKLKDYLQEIIGAGRYSNIIILEFLGRPDQFVAKGDKGDIVFHKLEFQKIVTVKPSNTIMFSDKSLDAYDKYLNGQIEILV